MGTPGLNARVVAPKNVSSPEKPEKQLTLFITIQVSPENIEKLKEASRPVWKACSEEPECLFFDVFQDQEVDGRFRYVEIWGRNKEWFLNEQMTKSYFKTMNDELEGVEFLERKIEFFEREGEGSVFSEEYLRGGKKMKKKVVVV